MNLAKADTKENIVVPRFQQLLRQHQRYSYTSAEYTDKSLQASRSEDRRAFKGTVFDIIHVSNSTKDTANKSIKLHER